MKTLFKNGLILIDNEFRYAHILVEDANILEISHSLDDLKDFDKEEDLAGKRLIPGFIDIHTHGAVGVDVNMKKYVDFLLLKELLLGYVLYLRIQLNKQNGV